MKKLILLSLAVGCACWCPRDVRAQDEPASVTPGQVSLQMAEPIASPYGAAPVELPYGAAGIWAKYPAGHLWTNYCEEHLHHSHGSCHQRWRKPACGAACAETPTSDCRDCTATAPDCGCSGGVLRGHHRQRPCGCAPMVDCPLCAVSKLFHSFQGREPQCAPVSTCARPTISNVPSSVLPSASASADSASADSASTDSGSNDAASTGAGPIEVKPAAELPRNVIPPSVRRIE